MFLASCAQVQELPHPAWPDQALALLRSAAAGAPGEGLPDETAAIAELDAALARMHSEAGSAQEVDAIADDLFGRLARAYATGALDLGVVDPAWRLPRNPAPEVEALREQAWRRGVSDVLSGLLPRGGAYLTLRAELARMRTEEVGAADANNPSRQGRADSLRATLERWRWLPRDLPGRRVEAHIAQFEVVLVTGGVNAQTHAAIVGARETQTLAFAATIRAVTLNPAWTVPRSILVNELLPRFRRDPAAAAELGYEVIDSQGRMHDPMEIDWSGRFPYALRRRPGPGNPLGQLKFEMPNPNW